MRRIALISCIALFLSAMPASLFLSGCGSADSGDYQREVSELNRETAERLEEPLHLLAEGVHGEGEEKVEALTASLEEAALVLSEALAELEEIKVPAGWEEYHRDLSAFYHANLASYEGYLATLAPGEEHTEGAEGGAEDEDAAAHEEETTGEEEAPHEGETPQQEEVPAESGGH